MSKRILILVCLVLLAVTGAVGYGHWSVGGGKGKSPQEVANQFLEALAKNDFDTMRKLSTEDSKSMIDMLESLASMSTDTEVVGKVEKVTKCNEQRDYTKCDVCCGENGSASSIELYKVNGQWLVHLEKE